MTRRELARLGGITEGGIQRIEGLAAGKAYGIVPAVQTIERLAAVLGMTGVQLIDLGREQVA